MEMSKNVLILIPARGGSKRIPRKNIRKLNGKPLIQYTIEYALQAELNARIIVSTDDMEIAEVSRQYGAETPFLRPNEISEDETLDYPVVAHCLDYLEREDMWVPDIVVFLRPTQPFRIKGEIEKAIEILNKNSTIDYVRTTQPVCYPPYWMKRINSNSLIEPFHDDMEALQYTRSQDLPNTVFCDGYVDAMRVSSLINYKKMFAGKVYAMHRDEIFFIDIDDEKDWDYAEYIFKKMH